MVHGHGAWCMVYGAWCMVYGAWCMVYGSWCMVHGAWCSPVGACRLGHEVIPGEGGVGGHLGMPPSSLQTNKTSTKQTSSKQATKQKKHEINMKNIKQTTINKHLPPAAHRALGDPRHPVGPGGALLVQPVPVEGPALGCR